MLSREGAGRAKGTSYGSVRGFDSVAIGAQKLTRVSNAAKEPAYLAELGGFEAQAIIVDERAVLLSC
jgi:hypothetical protein